VAVVVVKEWHRWLNLKGKKERSMAFLLDAPISPFGLIRDAVNTIVDRYKEANKQLPVCRELIPH